MKKIKIGLIATAAFLLIWIVEMLVYGIAHPTSKNAVPLPLVLQLVVVFTIWLLIGLFLLIKYFKTVRAELIKFINE